MKTRIKAKKKKKTFYKLFRKKNCLLFFMNQSGHLWKLSDADSIYTYIYIFLYTKVTSKIALITKVWRSFTSLHFIYIIEYIKLTTLVHLIHLIIYIYFKPFLSINQNTNGIGFFLYFIFHLCYFSKANTR